ncbi:NHL repeat-containing protein [bacterium]|nr:NHL repeat-containing protein [bacterium]
MAHTLFAGPQLVEKEPTSLLYPPFWHTPFGIHRGTPELLRLFLGNRTYLDQPQDLTCNLLLHNLGIQKPGPQFQISVLGANSGQGHLIYNPDLTHLDVVGDDLNSPHAFLQPAGVALHTNGTAYVVDPGRKEVVILKLKNNRLIPKGVLPQPPGGWQKPWGIALDSQGTLFITDTLRNQILIYTPDHAYTKSIGPDLPNKKRLAAPRAISVVDPGEPWSFYKSAFIFFSDQDGQRISRMDFAGNLHHQRTAASLGFSGEPAAFAWLELDYYENIWVTDPQRSEIHKFNRQLDHLVSFGQPGKGDGFFQSPTGIAIHRHFGQVFVADKQAAHYFWIGTDILDARAIRDPLKSATIKISYFLTEPAWITIRMNPSTKKQEILFDKKWFDSGAHLHHWHLPSQSAAKASAIEVLAVATYSSSQFKAKRKLLKLVPAISSAP